MNRTFSKIRCATTVIFVVIITTSCQESPEESRMRELREAVRLQNEKAWIGQRRCIELIKRVSRNPSTTQVPELYNAVEIENVPYRNGHIARFTWSGFNLVQAQNGFGAYIGVEASCEYDITTEQIYGLVFDGQIFMQDGEVIE